MSISPKSEHNGSSFGTPTPDPTVEDQLLGPAVKINAVNAARRAPRHRKEPVTPAPMPESLKNLPRPAKTPAEQSAATQTPVTPVASTQPAPAQPVPTQPAPARLVTTPAQAELVPAHMRVPAGHPRISDDFGGFNRYVGGNSISLNQYGGLDIGNGGPDGSVHTGVMVHIHTALTLRAG